MGATEDSLMGNILLYLMKEKETKYVIGKRFFLMGILIVLRNIIILFARLAPTYFLDYIHIISYVLNL